MSLTVFLVDDDDAVRGALALLLETAGFAVNTFASAEEFLAAYRLERPGCLLLDVRMPGMNGPKLQAELKRRGVTLPIIFLSGHGDIPLAVQTIKSGAVDFLTKPVQGSVLIEQVREVLARNHHRCACLAGLTGREWQVLKLAVEGLTNKEIAQSLAISHRTVEVHRTRILRKTGATNLLELARLVESCSSPADSKAEPD